VDEELVRKLSGGVLTKAEINERLSTGNLSQRIFITPIISKSQQIGTASVDIRLGTEFIVFRRTKYSILDVLDETKESLESSIGKYQEKVYIPIGEKLILHPQQLVLGCTLEYFRFPNDLVGEVIGRSSWGRLGLIISAATLVHPNFAGVITLELANEGDAPIALYPGVRIAQLVFNKFSNIKRLDEKLLNTKYIGAIGPSFSKLYEDTDWDIFRKLRKKI
jgi:dCTP deaminase